ncbi:hypothetical protein CRD60_03385 [Bifidobacterium aemilianum]|uniref:Integrase catalytic domain-containing protein n=1 Tax=Bifidobacterium aemilianum TaxID=2493120 RepID=A0A366K8Y3_9BIFI|nr:hypothetical protein [Bifidobacterium aemilianum]RBP98195.1 hypothetical protein CRD60_03385 [Bifidobacterium aemilianum]
MARAHQRRRRAKGRRAKGSWIERRRPIGSRPAGVDTRSEFGHWEADSVIGSGRCNLHTVVERKTRFLVARKVVGKSAANTIAAQLAVFTPLRPRPV